MEITQLICELFDAKSWEKGTFRNFYFIGEHCGRQLNGCLECELNQLAEYDGGRLTAVKDALTELDARAHAHIQRKFPADNAEELDLNDLVLLPDGGFKLGYYTGRTPMGETYLYVGFEPDFSLKDKIDVTGF